MDIRTIRGARAQKATLVLFGDPELVLNVKYLASAITPRALRELAEASGANEASTTLEESTSGVDSLISMLCSSITEWDLTQDGEPVALTPEGLDTVDVDVLSEVLTQLRTLQVPNDLSGMPTNAPS